MVNTSLAIPAVLPYNSRFRVALEGPGQSNGAIDGRSDYENPDQAGNGPPQNPIRRSAPLAKRPATFSPGSNLITDRPEVEDIASNNRPSGSRPRRIGRPAKILPTDAERRERRRRWLFILFMIALLVPGSFFIGPARLTPYRVFLLLAVLPLLWQVARGALGRLTAVDAFFVSYVFWLALATFVHEGMARYESIVVLTVESLCGYLFGRVMVRNASDYRQMMQVFLTSLLVLAPFALIEMATDQNLVARIAGTFLEPFGQGDLAPRMGLHRAQVSFEHPILFGLFCSLGFANAFYIYRLHRRKQLFWMGTSGFTTFASLSSAPLLALLLQSMMILWDRIARNLKAKWLILAGTGVAVFGVLELITPNGAVDFLVNNLTLVPETAEFRILTFEYVIEKVIEYPVFGIPPDTVVLPWWHTGSIDNYWLSTAITYGVPTTLFLFFAIVIHLVKVMGAEIAEDEASDVRTGHLIAVAALVFLLATVHIWGPVSVMIMIYLGAGAWIYVPEAARTSVRMRANRPVPSPVRPDSAPPEPARPQPATGRVRGSTGRYGSGA